MRSRLGILCGLFLAILAPMPGCAAEAPQASCVVHISVDALRPDAITALGPTALPNLYRLRTQGAFTDNARTDYDMTVTLPSHITQLTGRGVLGPAGHGWTLNSDLPEGETLHSHKGSYVASVFDVAHDGGLRTGCYAGKPKFSLFEISYNSENGAPDTTGPDNGRGKIDVYKYNANSVALVKAFLADAAAKPFQYVFLHLADPDFVGHGEGWDPAPGSGYSNCLKNTIDPLVGQVIHLIDTDPRLAGKTAVILTADHGGELKDHSNPALREDYTVPFCVWGPGVKAGADLYALNPKTRLDPGAGRPTYAAPVQPIRNGDAANLALMFLGLPPVPGSTINNRQDLAVGASARPPVRAAPAATGTAPSSEKAVPAPTATSRPPVPAPAPAGLPH